MKPFSKKQLQMEDLESQSGRDNSRKSSSADMFAMPLDSAMNSEVQRDRDIETLQQALEDPNARQSQLCCLCLCDLVKASITMNLMWIGLMITYITFSLVDPERLNSTFGIVPLDPVKDGESMDLVGIVGIIKVTIAFIYCILGIYGAMRFNKNLVLAACIGYVLYALLLLVDLKSGRWTGIFLAGIFLYPNAHLYISMRNGTITKETYEREASCFGSSNRDY